MNMKTADFDYHLPDNLIAQTPIEPRDASRLMVLSRHNNSLSHQHFYDIVDLLQPGDLLVLNNSKVFPARLCGKKRDTGGSIELLLLEQKQPLVWETLVKPGKKAKLGTQLIFGEGLLYGTIIDLLDNGNRLISFSCNGSIFETLEQIGQMPLPPYITQKLTNQQRYQTIYAQQLGSVAAPTAGLHFTDKLIAQLIQKGVQIEPITLHIGLGTFRPVKARHLIDHTMHTEHYMIPEKTAHLIAQTKQRGGRVIAVGTTSCRTLESVASTHGQIISCQGQTDIFIYPGYQFKVIDGLITNFHLPQSTLMMLVSALAGHQKIIHAYAQAIEHEYRFFSFGDAMFILP